VRPIGARREVDVDVRIVSATHTPLKPLVEEGKFRNDLYFRLNVIELPMPSLGDRPEDIPELAEHFLEDITREWETPTPEISTAAMEALQAHDFTGNVRELINILQRAVTLCEGTTIGVEDLMLEPFDDAPNRSEQTTDGEMPERSADESLDTYMGNIERKMLEDALRQARYNKTRAAEQLGISFRSLRYKLKKYGID
jgi:two-component system response regulator PilR (NtrC family)